MVFNNVNHIEKVINKLRKEYYQSAVNSLLAMNANYAFSAKTIQIYANLHDRQQRALNNVNELTNRFQVGRLLRYYTFESLMMEMNKYN